MNEKEFCLTSFLDFLLNSLLLFYLFLIFSLISLLLLLLLEFLPLNQISLISPSKKPNPTARFPLPCLFLHLPTLLSQTHITTSGSPESTAGHDPPPARSEHHRPSEVLPPSGLFNASPFRSPSRQILRFHTPAIAFSGDPRHSASPPSRRHPKPPSPAPLPRPIALPFEHLCSTAQAGHPRPQPVTPPFGPDPARAGRPTPVPATPHRPRLPGLLAFLQRLRQPSIVRSELHRPSSAPSLKAPLQTPSPSEKTLKSHPGQTPDQHPQLLDPPALLPAPATATRLPVTVPRFRQAALSSRA